MPHSSDPTGDPSRLLRELARADREIADLGALLEIKRGFRTALARRVADNVHLSAVAAAAPVPAGPAGTFNHSLPPAEPDEGAIPAAATEAALDDLLEAPGDVPPTTRERMEERFPREAAARREAVAAIVVGPTS